MCLGIFPVSSPLLTGRIYGLGLRGYRFEVTMEEPLSTCFDAIGSGRDPFVGALPWECGRHV